MNRIQLMTVTALTLLGGVALTNAPKHHVEAVDTNTASSSSSSSAESSSTSQNTQAAADATAQSVVSTHHMMTSDENADVNGNVNPVAVIKAREEAAAKRAAAAKKAAAKKAASQNGAATQSSTPATSSASASTTSTSTSGHATSKGTFKLSFYDPASMGSNMGYGGVAANLSVFPKGTRLKITLSNGTVWYKTVNDTGGFAAANPHQLDVAMPNSQIPSAGILYATVEVLS